MRTTVLLSMLLLTTACGVVEEKKDAALRHLGKATLNSVFRLANADGKNSAESTGRFTGAVVSEASSPPAPAQNAAPAPVSLTKASDPAGPAVLVPSVSPGTQAEGSFEFTFTRFDEVPDPIPGVRVLVRSHEGDKPHAEFARVVKKAKSGELVIRNETRKQAVAHAKVAAAALADRPLHIADFEVRFAEDLERVRMIPSAPSPPPAPEKECSSQLRTAS